jgi:hypothetical protein
MPRRHSRGSTRRAYVESPKLTGASFRPGEVTGMPRVEKSGRPAGAASAARATPHARARRVGSFGNRLLPGKATSRGRSRQRWGARAAVTGRTFPSLVTLARGTRRSRGPRASGRFAGAMISFHPGTASKVAPVPSQSSDLAGWRTRHGRDVAGADWVGRRGAARSRLGGWAPAARRGTRKTMDRVVFMVLGRAHRPTQQSGRRAKEPKTTARAACFGFDSRLAVWSTDRSWTKPHQSSGS